MNTNKDVQEDNYTQNNVDSIYLNGHRIFDLLDEAVQGEQLWDMLFEHFQMFEASNMSYYHLKPLGSFDYSERLFVCRGRDDTAIKTYGKKISGHNSAIGKTRFMDEPMSFRTFCASFKMSGEQLQTVKEFHFECTPNGIIFPLHGAMGQSGCVVLGFEDKERLHSKRDVRHLHWVSQTAHRVYCQLKAQSRYRPKGLSKREREVLTWVARGKSNSVIAEIIGISPHTVNGYLRSIYLKTGTSDRTTATLKGIGEGLIDF